MLMCAMSSGRISVTDLGCHVGCDTQNINSCSVYYHWKAQRTFIISFITGEEHKFYMLSMYNNKQKLGSSKLDS